MEQPMPTFYRCHVDERIEQVNLSWRSCWPCLLAAASVSLPVNGQRAVADRFCAEAIRSRVSQMAWWLYSFRAHKTSFIAKSLGPSEKQALAFTERQHVPRQARALVVLANSKFEIVGE